MNTVRGFLIISFVICGTYSFSQNGDYTASRTLLTPVIDGHMDDEAWKDVEWGGNLIQFEPYNGKSASQSTQYKISYDDNNLFVLIRCHDTEAEKI